MFHILIDFLTIDTWCFLLLSLITRKRVLTKGRHIPQALRWLILVAFPCFIFLLVLQKPARKLHQSKRLYQICYLIYWVGYLFLIIIIFFVHSSTFIDAVLLLFFWILLLDQLSNGPDEHNPDDHHDDPTPDDPDPAPTGDAVNRWLLHQRAQSAASSCQKSE